MTTNMKLSDDGTLDTVIACKDCGEEMRYNFGDDNEPRGEDSSAAYDRFVAECIEDATREHLCVTEDAIDDMFSSYVETALWSSSECDSEGNDKGSFESQNYDETDLSDEARASMRKDCADFLSSNRDDIGDEYASAGHNFWLTRNGHGAGFWDSSEFRGRVGARLTEASKAYGSSDVYLGDDGKLHVS